MGSSKNTIVTTSVNETADNRAGADAGGLALSNSTIHISESISQGTADILARVLDSNDRILSKFYATEGAPAAAPVAQAAAPDYGKYFPMLALGLGAIALVFAFKK